MAPIVAPVADAGDATAPLTVEQQAWQDLSLSFAKEPTRLRPRGPLVHRAAPDGTRVTEWLGEPMSEKDALARGWTVLPFLKPSVVMIDLDAPERELPDPDVASVAAGAAPAEWVAVRRAVGLCSDPGQPLTIVVCESGSETGGVAHQIGLCDAVTVSAAEAIVALVRLFVGRGGVAEVSSDRHAWRALMTRSVKPGRRPLPATGGILGVDGWPQPMTAAEVGMLVRQGRPLAAQKIAELVTSHAVSPAPARRVISDDSRAWVAPTDSRPARHADAVLASLTPRLRSIAHTDGRGMSAEPTRNGGEFALLCGMRRFGCTAEEVWAVLDGFPIGDRMRFERMHDGSLRRRAPWEQRRYLDRRIMEADAAVGQTKLAAADVDELVAGAWDVPCAGAQRVALAVLIEACAAEGKVVAGLAASRLEQRSGMAGKTAIAALKSHPAVELVEKGRGKAPSTWRIKRMPAPRRTAPPPPWRAVAAVASDLGTRGGVLGETDRALPILVMACLTTGPAGREALCRALDTSPQKQTIDGAIRRLLSAGVVVAEGGRPLSSAYPHKMADRTYALAPGNPAWLVAAERGRLWDLAALEARHHRESRRNVDRLTALAEQEAKIAAAERDQKMTVVLEVPPDLEALATATPLYDPDEAPPVERIDRVADWALQDPADPAPGHARIPTQRSLGAAMDDGRTFAPADAPAAPAIVAASGPAAAGWAALAAGLDASCRALPDRCSGCGWHPVKQGHATDCPAHPGGAGPLNPPTNESCSTAHLTCPECGERVDDPSPLARCRERHHSTASLAEFVTRLEGRTLELAA